MGITAETVTVVVASPTDWTGPIVGIVGVVLGSLMGLSGIRWQHDAQRAYDVRKQCADLIFIGESLRNSYLTNRNGMAVSEVPSYLDSLSVKGEQMDRFLRHLQLIAGKKTEELATDYTRASNLYQEMALLHYKFRAKPDLNDLSQASSTWSTARTELIAALNPKHSRTQRRSWALEGGVTSWFRRLKEAAKLRKPQVADQAGPTNDN